VNDEAIRQEIVQDLRIGNGRVLYLEGRSDVPIFFALLGLKPPQVPDEGRTHQGVLVRGMKTERGSGANAVRQRVAVAGASGSHFAGVRGLVDGDGDLHAELAPCFDAPFAGQPHRWKTYCIENLLAQVGWPWSEAPDWREVLRVYAPYAALNRVRTRVSRYLAELGLAKFTNPALGQPLRTREEFEAQLITDDDAFRRGVDVCALFRQESERVDEALARPELHEAHALINGKWLVDVYAPTTMRRTPDACRREWSGWVAAQGGHPEVRAWWQRWLGA